MERPGGEAEAAAAAARQGTQNGGESSQPAHPPQPHRRASCNKQFDGIAPRFSLFSRVICGYLVKLGRLGIFLEANAAGPAGGGWFIMPCGIRVVKTASPSPPRWRRRPHDGRKCPFPLISLLDCDERESSEEKLTLFIFYHHDFIFNESTKTEKFT